MIEFDLTFDEYQAEYFERKPHVFRSAMAERPLAWSDVDQLLHVIDPSPPATRMFFNGIVPEQEYAEGYVKLGKQRVAFKQARFYELLRNGATLVINHFENYSVAAKRLCTEIGRFTGTQTSGNAYMSFSGGGTFGKHWDTHDVFAVQLIGRKHWKVFSPTFPLPLTYQTNDRSGHTCPAEPALEFVLEEGDMVYLPRGWWHHVIPLDGGSFHLSVGAYAPSLYDFILLTASRLMEREPIARRSFSPDTYRETLAELTPKLAAAFLDPGSVDHFLHDAVTRERMSGEFNLDLFLNDEARLPGSAVVSLTSCQAPGPIVERGEVLVNGAALRLDPLGETVVAALRDRLALDVDALCARLPHSPDAVRDAVLNLARHNIVTIRVGLDSR